mgnify:CR=1 FL=1
MFPLGSPLLPGALLPLHVFEPRYRQMIQDILADDVNPPEFGVAMIERGVARAGEKGLSPRLAREVLETLIHHSIGDQETHQLAQSGHGQGARALVIGGLGRMGA